MHFSVLHTPQLEANQHADTDLYFWVRTWSRRVFVICEDFFLFGSRTGEENQKSNIFIFFCKLWIWKLSFSVFFFFPPLQFRVFAVISFWQPPQCQRDYVCHRFSMLLQAGLKLGLVWPKDNSSANETDLSDLMSRCSASVSHFLPLLPGGLKPACQCERTCWATTVCVRSEFCLIPTLIAVPDSYLWSLVVNSIPYLIVSISKIFFPEMVALFREVILHPSGLFQIVTNCCCMSPAIARIWGQYLRGGG